MSYKMYFLVILGNVDVSELNKTNVKRALNSVLKNDILNNIESVEIWSATSDFSTSITSFLYKK